MTDYDDLFDDVAAADSVFADKGPLNLLVNPDDVVARNDQDQSLSNSRRGALNIGRYRWGRWLGGRYCRRDTGRWPRPRG